MFSDILIIVLRGGVSFRRLGGGQIITPVYTQQKPTVILITHKEIILLGWKPDLKARV